MIHSASLINDPFGDPCVYVDFKFRREAFLFDLGELHVLPSRKLLKINHIFVSHTHMDHFIGFDHLVRISLGRDRRIYLYGPPNFLQNVEDKLRSYTWNLVGNYTNNFELQVMEVRPEYTLSRRYSCRNAFRTEGSKEQILTVRLCRRILFSSGRLDHDTPSLAFSFTEKMHINIKKNVLQEMGLPMGAWLLDLKRRIRERVPGDPLMRVWWRGGEGHVEEKMVPLEVLRKRAVMITPGQKISYITDALYSGENIRRIIELASGSDLVFIEAPFLHEDADMAARKHHLTARQAGMLARAAGAKRMVPFHYSPKYKGAGDRLYDEAMRAFREEIG